MFILKPVILSAARLRPVSRTVVLIVIAASAAMVSAAYAMDVRAESLPAMLIRLAGLSGTAPAATREHDLKNELGGLAPQLTLLTGDLAVARSGQTATKLADGRVLVAGGDAGGTAEIYDPATDSFSATGSMTAERAGHTATLLSDGRVLIIGGTVGGSAVASTEIYDPSTGTFSPSPSTNAARSGHTATTLGDGRVVVIAGDASGSIEIYDPAANTFSTLPVALATTRSGHAAAVLQNGNILVVGGTAPDGSNVQTGEIVDVANGAVSAVSNTMADAHDHALLRVLSDGKVQIIGGTDHADMEIYDPAINAFGAHSHVFPIGDSHPELVQQITDAPTRAALFYRGASGSLLDREGQTITELPAANKALVVGGTDSTGAVLSSSSLLNSSPASITTDKLDYAPGTPVVVTGTGFAPNETVTLTFHEDPHPATENPHTFTVTTDANGNFTDQQYAPEDSDVGVAYVLAAVGGTSGYTAQTALHDALNVSNAPITVKKSDCLTNSTSFVLGDTVCASIAVTASGSGAADTYFIQWYRPGAGVQAQQTTKSVTATSQTDTDSLTLSAANASAGTWTITTCKVSGSTCPSNRILNSVTFSAGQGSTSTTLSSSENPASSGNPVTFTASVTRTQGAATPSGTVQFKDGTTLLGTSTLDASAKATFTTSTFSVATHSITAVYSGDTNYSGSTSAAFSQVINAPTCAPICSTDVWSAESSMPNARGGAMSAELNGKMYVISGFGSSGLTNEVDSFDPTTGIWTVKAPIPNARVYGGATSLNGKLYVVGGCLGNDCGIGTTNVVDVYDPTTNSWSSAAPLSVARHAFAIGTINGKIIVAGGRQACPPCNDAPTTEVYDPSTNTWSTKAGMPTPRNSTGYAVLNNLLYVVGGSTSAGVSGAVEAFDPAANSWSTQASMLTPRTAPGVASIRGKIFAISGKIATSPFTTNIVEAYDPGTNSWSSKAPIPTARYGAQPVSTNGRIYVAGNGAGNSAISTVESYQAMSLANMVAWYPGNNNTNDVMGGNNGTWVGTSAFNASGKVNQAFSFNGSSYVDAGNPAALNITGNQVSLDGWVNPTDTSSRIYFGKTLYGANDYLIFNNSGRLSSLIKIAGSENEVQGFADFPTNTVPYSMPVNQWTHVALTYDGSKIRLYANGAQVGEASKTGNIDGDNEPFVIGGRAVDNGTAKFIGGIDEVEVFNRAISAAEVKAIFDASFLGKCNTAPAANSQSVTTNANTPLPITLSATDAEGNFLTYLVNNGLVATTHGTLSATNSSTLVYTPTTGYSGPDSFTFKVNDGFVDSNTATVTINVHCTGPTVSTNPTAATVTYGEPTVTFTAAANGVPTPAVQWQVSTNGGASYTPISNTGNYSGVTTNSLTITLPTVAQSGSLYRAEFTNSCAVADSSPALLTVNPKALTASIIGNPTKVYDGNTNATLTAANFSVSGTIGSESFTVNQTAGSYGPDADAGLKTVTAALTPANFTPGSGTSATNYTFPTSATGSGTITPAATNLLATAVTGTYGGTVTLTATLTRTSVPAGVLSGKTVTFTLNGNTVGSAPTDATGVASLPNVYLTSDGAAAGTRISAGSYPTGLGASFATENNYTGSNDSKLLTVQQKSVTASVTASSKVYDGTDVASIALCTPAVIETGDDVSCTATGPNTFDNKNAGAGKTVTARGIALGGASAANYALSAVTATTTADILTKGITATLNAVDKIYDGSTTEPDGSMSCSFAGVIAADTSNIACTPSAGSFNSKDVATANLVTATVTIGGGEAANYTLGANGTLVSSAGATDAAHITQRALTAAIIGGPSKPYDGNATAILSPANFELMNLVSGEGFNITQTVGMYNSPTVAGASSVTATLSAADFTPTGGADASNYVLPTIAAGAGSITLRPAVWTTNPASKTYGDADPDPLTAGSGSNFVDPVSATYSRVAGELASPPTYHITATLSAGPGVLDNYAITNDGAEFTINKRVATWTTNANSKTYGSDDPSPVTSGSGNNFIAVDNVTANYSRDAGENVGPYHITATLSAAPLSALDNYVITNDGATFTIAAATLSVDAVAGGKIYGDNDPALTYTLNGFKFGQDATTAGVTGQGICSRTAGETVAGSPYVISCVPADLAAANYVFASGTPADFNITPATLSVNAVANSKIYGDSDPAFSNALSGFKFSDTDTTSSITGTASCSRTPGETVAGSPYLISCAPGTLAAPNYVFATGSGASFTINARLATWTTDPSSKTYGDADPSPLTTGNGSNFVPADNITATYSRATGENASPPTYHITATLQDPNNKLANYIVTNEGAEFTIARRPATVAANPKTKVYGEANPPLDATVTGTVNGDVLNYTLATTADSYSGAGSYPITVTLGSNPNYDISPSNSGLTVTLRPLTVAADPQSKTYGDADPALSYQITSGNLVNGDMASGGLTRAPGEDVGSYPITQGSLTVSSNYDLTFVPSSLNITKKTASVTPAGASKTYGDSDPSLTGTLTGFLVSDNVTATYGRTAGENAGTYTINATLSPIVVLGNYDIAYNTATFTINKRNATWTTNNSGKLYLSPDPSGLTTGSGSNFVAGDGVNATYTRVAGETVGTYHISANLSSSVADALNNYNITNTGATFTISNTAPSALLVSGSTISENGTATVGGSFVDSDPFQAHTVTITWNDAGPSTTLNLPADTLTFSAGHQYLDDNPTATPTDNYSISVTVTDGADVASGGTTVIVNNVAPSINSFGGIPGAPIPAGSAVSLTANFSDVGTKDTHTCSINWDDGGSPASGTVVETDGSGTCSASKTFSVPGVYTVSTTVTDDDNGAVTAGLPSQYIVVYDPSAGFVTGGGWINSPRGACKLDWCTDATVGKANFGFVSKYKKGSSTPDGQTQFQFQAGNLDFHSSSYDAGSLVVSGYKAQYKGTGTINGVGGYRFILTAYDGNASGGGGIDKFRMKIYLGTNVVYDNVMGASDDIDIANPMALGGGSINIQKN